MTGYMTRQRTSSETGLQKPTARRRTSLSEIAKPISKSKSAVKKVSEINDNNKATVEKVLSKPKRLSAKKQSVTSIKPNENDVDERKKGVARRKSPRVRHDKASAKAINGAARGRASKKNKDENSAKKQIKKKISKNMSGQRQMSLKESFLNHSMSKQLRPRRIAKTYREDSTLTERSLSLDKGNSVVLLEKINDKKEKVPIYKTVSRDEPVKKAEEIYDFQFDVNDTKERVPKKRKKRLIERRVAKRNAKNVIPKRNGQIGKDAKVELPVTKPTEDNEEINAENKIQLYATVCQSEDAFDRDVGDIGEKNNLIQSGLPDNENPEGKKDNAVKFAKPTIVSVESWKGNRVTLARDSSRINLEEFRPFRPTNIFDANKLAIPQENAHNQSLFEKSLSPITRISYFDPGSPWRGPQTRTFSQFRNAFQSTPQNPKVEISSGRIVRVKSNESKTPVNMTNVKDTLQRNNENVSVEKNVNMNRVKKGHSTPVRRFGTEITNLDHSVQFNTPTGEVGERTVAEAENALPNVQSVDTSSNVNSISMFDDDEDKENSILNCQTPKNLQKKGSKRAKFRNPQETKVKPQNIKLMKSEDPQSKPPGAQLRTVLNEEKVLKPKTSQRNHQLDENLGPQPGPSGLQRHTAFNEQRLLLRQEITSKTQNIQLEGNADPQPGPSGVQRHAVSNEQRVLRQSNLNNFLNLVDMPQSTTIETSHGLFSDTYSTPVSGKTIKKSELCGGMGIHDAFGFDEDYYSQNTTPIKVASDDKNPRRIVRLKRAKEPDEKPVVPARLSIGEIRNNLLPTTARDETIEKKGGNRQNVKVNGPLAISKPKAQIDLTNFSDTFDMLSETGEEPANTTECPLFADLEPCRFTKPPKHFYKRKRDVAFSFAEDSSSGEENDLFQNQVKRKRVGKMKKEDEKRLREWIDNVNQTFSEIDQHDLVVE